MADLQAILANAINPAFELLPEKMQSDAARVMLLSIGQQESRFEFRYQKTNDPYITGPAHGFWQNERGGLQCVLTNESTKDYAASLCLARNVSFDSSLVWSAVAEDDVLAAGMARLFLWADIKPLPAVDADHETAWQCYLRNWRPGKPHRETWDAFHAAAQAAIAE